MEFQFHPASARATVRTLPLSDAGQWALVGAAGVVALLATSLWFTVPRVLRSRLGQDGSQRVAAEIAAQRAEREQLVSRSLLLRRKALDTGDLLNRVAFLYDVPPSGWPRVLNPERPALASDDPDQIVAGVSLYLRGMERGRDLLESAERNDPELARRTPAIFPFEGTTFEPSAFFGPRISPWTGAEEFFPGVDLSAPAASPVVAAGGGTVVFTGAVRRSATGWLWRLGSIVVVSHGAQGATIYGHLGRIEVRRGQQVSRRQRLGIVGSTGWAISSQLHYEYWRRSGAGFRPTDPMFAGLDRRGTQPPRSLEQMLAASVPGTLDPLPGLEISAEKVGAPERPAGGSSGRSGRRRRHI
jgi:murein DD-endopeptidase MepM/ murein hydrolase activator NlpD